MDDLADTTALTLRERVAALLPWEKQERPAEEMTIEAVLAAVEAAYGREPTKRELVDVCCAIARFLQVAEEQGRPLADCRRSVETLRIVMGGPQ